MQTKEGSRNIQKEGDFVEGNLYVNGPLHYFCGTDPYPFCTAGLYAAGKPKVELYKRADVTKKSRTIFALNAYTQFPLQILLGGYHETYAQTEKFDPKPAPQVNIMYAVDAVKWIHQFIEWYNTTGSKTEEVYWFVYSDNIYAYHKHIFYSFDGTKMESSCGKPEYVGSILNQCVENMNKKTFVRFELEGLSTEEKLVSSDVLNKYKQILDERFNMYEQTKDPRLLFVKAEKDTILDPTRLANKLIKNHAVTYELMSALVDGKYITGYDIQENYAEFEQDVKMPAWFNNYISYLKEQISSCHVVNGNASVNINFMPSGNTFTTVLNTTVSLNTVLQFGRTPEEMVDIINQAPDKKGNFGSAVLTSEAILDLHVLGTQPAEGFYRMDLLGYDLFYKDKVGWATVLRKESLLAGPIYYDSKRLGDSREVNLSIAMSYLINGGLWLTDLASANLYQILKFPWVTDFVERTLKDIQVQTNAEAYDSPSGDMLDFVLAVTSRRSSNGWWGEFLNRCFETSVLIKGSSYDTYRTEVIRTFLERLAAVHPALPTDPVKLAKKLPETLNTLMKTNSENFREHFAITLNDWLQQIIEEYDHPERSKQELASTKSRYASLLQTLISFLSDHEPMKLFVFPTFAETVRSLGFITSDMNKDLARFILISQSLTF